MRLLSLELGSRFPFKGFMLAVEPFHLFFGALKNSFSPNEIVRRETPNSCYALPEVLPSDSVLAFYQFALTAIGSGN
jgi:hypothetical protein